jgi:hypothetical protein
LELFCSKLLLDKLLPKADAEENEKLAEGLVSPVGAVVCSDDEPMPVEAPALVRE